MSTTWTTEQILALAPDASSAKSGKELANARKWVRTGRKDDALWGECQGSGKDPYQTQIDLSEPAFHCSCPSRKFPCKHALGLFLIHAAQEVAETERPEWVTKWFSGRTEKAEQRAKKEAAKADGTAPAVDEAARAKRAAQREAKVTKGLQELDLWLRDLIRNGLADAASKPYSFWDGMGARLVDAQAPGLARAVRELAGIPSSGPGWQDRLLRALGSIYLAIEGYQRWETLPAEVQADLKDVVGFTVREEELLTQPGVTDTWRVLGQRIEIEERLKVQRIWLHGETTGRPALLLHFAHGVSPLDASFAIGTTVAADLVFFPGAAPLRAIVRTRQATETTNHAPNGGYAGLREAHDAAQRATALFPWQERYPLLLSAVTPYRTANGVWWARDVDGNTLLLHSGFDRPWHLAAVSGGHPITLFGEWDGAALLPLTAWTGGRLAATWAQSTANA